MKKLILAIAITLTGCAAPQYHTSTLLDRMEKVDIIAVSDGMPFLVCFGDQDDYIRDMYNKEIKELRKTMGEYTTRREIDTRAESLDMVYHRQFIIDNIDEFSIEGLNYSDAEMCKHFFETNKEYLLSLK